MKRCKTCGKDFIQIGRREVCGTCFLDKGRTTREERMAKVGAWMWERRLKVEWLKDAKWAKRRGYDGVVMVPHVGKVRLGLGRLRVGCEMAVTQGLTAKFRCGRMGKGVRKVWRGKKQDEGFKWPGRCECRGCGVRRYLELEEAIREAEG